MQNQETKQLISQGNMQTEPTNRGRLNDDGDAGLIPVLSVGQWRRSVQTRRVSAIY